MKILRKNALSILWVDPGRIYSGSILHVDSKSWCYFCGCMPLGYDVNKKSIGILSNDCILVNNWIMPEETAQSYNLHQSIHNFFLYNICRICLNLPRRRRPDGGFLNHAVFLSFNSIPEIRWNWSDFFKKSNLMITKILMSRFRNVLVCHIWSSYWRVMIF